MAPTLHVLVSRLSAWRQSVLSPVVLALITVVLRTKPDDATAAEDNISVVQLIEGFVEVGFAI